MITAAGDVFGVTASQPKCGRDRGATHPAAKIRCFLGEVFDEMHLPFRSAFGANKIRPGTGRFKADEVQRRVRLSRKAP
jgi:hypothetical protein